MMLVYEEDKKRYRNIVGDAEWVSLDDMHNHLRRAWNSFRCEGEITSNVLTIKKWEGISISAGNALQNVIKLFVIFTINMAIQLVNILTQSGQQISSIS